jgi:2OG-Fe(II) oxygenase superfamily
MSIYLFRGSLCPQFNTRDFSITHASRDGTLRRQWGSFCALTTWSIHAEWCVPDHLIYPCKAWHAPITRSTHSSSRCDLSVCLARRQGDTLGGHQDDAECDLTQPIVSVSVGCAAVFLLGGSSRDVAPTAMLLRSGDVVVRQDRHTLSVYLLKSRSGAAATSWCGKIDTPSVSIYLIESKWRSARPCLPRVCAGAKKR